MSHCTLLFVATYEHPIIVRKESQRITGNIAVFGIKNARELVLRAGQDIFCVRCGVNQMRSVGLPTGFHKHHFPICNDFFQLASRSRAALLARGEINVCSVGSQGGIGAAREKRQLGRR